MKLSHIFVIEIFKNTFIVFQSLSSFSIMQKPAARDLAGIVFVVLWLKPTPLCYSSVIHPECQRGLVIARKAGSVP